MTRPRSAGNEFGTEEAAKSAFGVLVEALGKKTVKVLLSSADAESYNGYGGITFTEDLDGSNVRIDVRPDMVDFTVHGVGPIAIKRSVADGLLQEDVPLIGQPEMPHPSEQPGPKA